MLTLNDGRAELWQWDTGRTLAVDADCSQVHFSNKVFGRSIDVDVVDGTAIIPDVLLQTDKDLNVWAFVGTAENGYTKISKTLTVNRRNKPADYVFTPTDQTSIEEIKERLEYLEQNPVVPDLSNYATKDEIPDVSGFATKEEIPVIPEALPNPNALTFTGAVNATYDGSKPLTVNVPSLTVDDSLTQSGQAADAKATGDAISSLSGKIENLPSGGAGLTTAEKTAMLALFKAAAYTSDVSSTIANLETLWSGGGGDSGGDSGESVSASYSNGNLTIDGVAVVYNSAALYMSGVSATYNNGVLALN